MYPAKVTVPDAAAEYGVPDDAAISSPVCVLLLILLLAPNLDVIVPETGLAKAIPNETFCPDVFKDVLTEPVDLTLEVLDVFFATLVLTAFGA